MEKKQDIKKELEEMQADAKRNEEENIKAGIEKQNVIDEVLNSEPLQEEEIVHAIAEQSKECLIQKLIEKGASYYQCERSKKVIFEKDNRVIGEINAHKPVEVILIYGE